LALARAEVVAHAAQVRGRARDAPELRDVGGATAARRAEVGFGDAPPWVAQRFSRGLRDRAVCEFVKFGPRALVAHGQEALAVRQVAEVVSVACVASKIFERV